MGKASNGSRHDSSVQRPPQVCVVRLLRVHPTALPARYRRAFSSNNEVPPIRSLEEVCFVWRPYRVSHVVAGKEKPTGTDFLDVRFI